MVSSVTPSSAMPLLVLSFPPWEEPETESCARYAPGPTLLFCLAGDAPRCGAPSTPTSATGVALWLFSAALSHTGSSSSRSTSSSITRDGPSVISTSGSPLSTTTPRRWLLLVDPAPFLPDLFPARALFSADDAGDVGEPPPLGVCLFALPPRMDASSASSWSTNEPLPSSWLYSLRMRATSLAHSGL